MINFALALVGGLGVLFIWSGLTHAFATKIGGAQKRVRLTNAEDEQIRLSPLLDRALGPFLGSAAHALALTLRREDKDRDLIAAAGYPARYRTVYTFYAWKVVIAVGFFLQGILLALVISPEWIFAAFMLGVIGLYLPDFHLRGLVNKRRELVRTEMAFVLHRLAIQVAAGQALPQALEQIAIKAGGQFVRELRQVSADISSGTGLPQALEQLAQRTAGIDDVRRLVSLLLRALELGSPIADALTSMGCILQDRVQQDIEARGMVASTQMILPIGCLILPAIGIVVLGPVAFIAAQFFL